MTSSTVSALPQQSEAARILNSTRQEKASGVHPSIVLLGRFLFSLIFIMSAAGHFSKETIAYAAAQGVPSASITVPFSGIIALLGGLSILFGYRATPESEIAQRSTRRSSIDRQIGCLILPVAR